MRLNLVRNLNRPNSPDVFRLIILSTVFAGMSGGFLLAKDPCWSLTPFKSSKGGYSARVLEWWSVAETLNDGRYEATFAAKTPDAPDTCGGVSFSVARTVKAEDLCPIHGNDFDRTAAVYAEQFLRERFDSGQGLFKQTNISTPGILSQSFLLGGDIKKPECRAYWLMVGIKDGGGFQAVWEVPCPLIEGNIRELSLMTKYLRVSKHWGD